jgi:hypothetical protein
MDKKKYTGRSPLGKPMRGRFGDNSDILVLKIKEIRWENGHIFESRPLLGRGEKGGKMQSKILREIYEFEKNSAERVRIVLQEYNKKQYVDVRVYYDGSDTAVPDWKPTKKGICFGLDLLDPLHEGIKKALALLEGDSGSN